MSDYDVITIGAGNNGLAASFLLAKSGMKTLIVEKTPYTGGLASNVSWFPGHTNNVGAFLMMFSQESIWNMLEVRKYGCELIPVPVFQTWFSTPDKPPIIMYTDPIKLLDYIKEEFGQEWVDGYTRMLQFYEPFSIGMNQAVMNPPISIGQMIDSIPSIEGKNAMRKVFFRSAADMLDEFFPDDERGDAIKGQLACFACDGFWGGPRTPGSAFNLAFHLTQATGVYYVKGGMGKYSEALAKGFEDKGGQIRHESPVKKLLIKNGKAEGVELEDGEKITADVVLSNCDATVTYMKFIGEENLPSQVVGMVKDIAYKNPYIMIWYRLKGLPEYTGRFSHFLKGGALEGINPGYTTSMQCAEDAWDACKNGRIPSWANGGTHFFSVLDPSVVPEGEHTCSGFYMHFPITAPRNKWDELKEKYADVVDETASKYSPNWKDIILDRKVWHPGDYEEVFSDTRGDFDHGTFAIEQMLDNRPMPGWANYATPVKNFYLCGSAAHPGWGVTSMPGINCANKVLKDLGKKK